MPIDPDQHRPGMPIGKQRACQAGTIWNFSLFSRNRHHRPERSGCPEARCCRKRPHCSRKICSLFSRAPSFGNRDRPPRNSADQHRRCMSGIANSAPDHLRRAGRTLGGRDRGGGSVECVAYCLGILRTCTIISQNAATARQLPDPGQASRLGPGPAGRCLPFDDNGLSIRAQLGIAFASQGPRWMPA